MKHHYSLEFVRDDILNLILLRNKSLQPVLFFSVGKHESNLFQQYFDLAGHVDSAYFLDMVAINQEPDPCFSPFKHTPGDCFTSEGDIIYHVRVSLNNNYFILGFYESKFTEVIPILESEEVMVGMRNFYDKHNLTSIG